MFEKRVSSQVVMRVTGNSRNANGSTGRARVVSLRCTRSAGAALEISSASMDVRMANAGEPEPASPPAQPPAERGTSADRARGSGVAASAPRYDFVAVRRGRKVLARSPLGGSGMWPSRPSSRGSTRRSGLRHLFAVPGSARMPRSLRIELLEDDEQVRVALSPVHGRRGARKRRGFRGRAIRIAGLLAWPVHAALFFLFGLLMRILLIGVCLVRAALDRGGQAGHGVAARSRRMRRSSR